MFKVQKLIWNTDNNFAFWDDTQGESFITTDSEEKVKAFVEQKNTENIKLLLDVLVRRYDIQRNEIEKITKQIDAAKILSNEQAELLGVDLARFEREIKKAEDVKERVTSEIQMVKTDLANVAFFSSGIQFLSNITSSIPYKTYDFHPLVSVRWEYNEITSHTIVTNSDGTLGYRVKHEDDE